MRSRIGNTHVSGTLTTTRSRGSRHEPRLREGWDRGLDPPLRLAVKNPFPARRVLVDFEVSDGVALSLQFAGPIPADLPDLIASASRTKCDLWHRWLAEDRKSTRLNSSHLVISY